MTSPRTPWDEPGWHVGVSKVEFTNPFLQVRVERVTSPARAEPVEWTTSRRKSACVVAARTACGKFLLIRQERIPIRRTIWEFPAGQIDCGGADEGMIRRTALRELEEETGYGLAAGGSILYLGHFFSSPGFTDEMAHQFLVEPVEMRLSGWAHDTHESILECGAFSFDELSRMIAEGCIVDANTLALFARIVSRGLVPTVV